MRTDRRADVAQMSIYARSAQLLEPILRHVPDRLLLPLGLLLAAWPPAALFVSHDVPRSWPQRLILLPVYLASVAYELNVARSDVQDPALSRGETADELACQYAAWLGAAIGKRGAGQWLVQTPTKDRITSTLAIEVWLLRDPPETCVLQAARRWT